MTGRTQVGKWSFDSSGRLGLEQISEQASGRGAGKITGGQSEGFKTGDSIVLPQHPLAFVDREVPSRTMGHHCADHFGKIRVDGIRFRQISRIRNQEFTWCVSGKGVGKFATVATLQREGPGRKFGDGDGHPIIRSRCHRGHEVLAAGLEEGFVYQRSRCEDPGDRSIDHALCILRILNLVADRDANALFDESSKIILCGMVRHPGHGHALGPLGQGDSEESVGRLRIRTEQLVEVAHSKKQQAVRMRRFEARELSHRGGFPLGTAIGVRKSGAVLDGCRSHSGSLRGRFLVDRGQPVGPT